MRTKFFLYNLSNQLTQPVCDVVFGRITKADYDVKALQFTGNDKDKPNSLVKIVLSKGNRSRHFTMMQEYNVRLRLIKDMYFPRKNLFVKLLNYKKYKELALKGSYAIMQWERLLLVKYFDTKL